MRKGTIRLIGATMVAGFAAVSFGFRDDPNYLLLAVFEAAAIAVGILGVRDIRAEEREEREGR